MLVICNGMPRSGSTLQYNLVRGIVEITDNGSGQGFFDPNQAVDSYSQFERWAEEPGFHVIKTQAVFPGLNKLLQSDKASICYTFRDLRDVAASLERRFKGQGKELYKILDDIVTEYYTIQGFPHLISVRYEEMTSDLEGTVSHMAQALGISPKPAEIISVAEEFSLSSAKKKIERFELRYKIADVIRKGLAKCGIDYVPSFFDSKTLMHSGHIAPENSSREDYLPADQIARITDIHREWLVECGYITET